MTLTSPSDQVPDRSPAYVCLRLPGTYDGKEPLFGFEFRTLSKKAPSIEQEKMKKLMDSTQYAIAHQEYGLPKKKFENWIRTELQEKSSNRDILGHVSKEEMVQFVDIQIKNLYYGRKIDLSFLMEVFGRKKGREVDNRLVNEHLRSNQAIPILTHDWSHDPLLFENPRTQKNS